MIMALNRRMISDYWRSRVSISIGIEIFKIILKEKFSEVDLIDETGASRHAVSAWMKGLINNNMILPCGERRLGEKSVELWQFNHDYLNDKLT